AELAAVTLHVVPAAAASAAEMTPSGMVFVAQQGGAAPAPQNLTVSNLGGGGDLTFQATASTFSGGGWLSVSPDGSVGAAIVQVSVNPAGLAPGIYRGAISGTFSSGESQETQVVLVVTPAPSRAFPSPGACSPQAMELIAATIGNNSSLPLT